MAASHDKTMRDAVCEAYADGAAYGDISKRFEISYNQAKGIVYRHATDEQKSRHDGEVKAFDRIRAKQERRDELAELRKIVRVRAREENAHTAVLQAIEKAAPKLRDPGYVPRFAESKDASKETGVLVFGDWHGEEVVELDRMDGFNEYNLEICAARAAHIVQTAINIADRKERGGGWKIENLVVPMLGDMVSGTIHELEKHAGRPVTESVIIVGQILASSLRQLAGRFEHVDAIGISGNHGRMSPKKQYKEPTRTWDYLIYQWAKNSLRDVPNVTVSTPRKYSTIIDVRGYNFWLTHGDEFRGWMGLPYYSMQRGLLKRQALESTRGGFIHYTLMGHHHHEAKVPQAQGEAYVNGSLIGGNEFGLEAFQGNPTPSQIFFGVKEGKGITFQYSLKADTLDDDLPDYYIDDLHE